MEQFTEVDGYFIYLRLSMCFIPPRFYYLSVSITNYELIEYIFPLSASHLSALYRITQQAASFAFRGHVERDIPLRKSESHRRSPDAREEQARRICKSDLPPHPAFEACLASTALQLPYLLSI